VAGRLDLLKQLKALYGGTGTPAVVDVPAMNFLMVGGHGDPNTSPLYASAIAALYSVSYTLKFALKQGPEAVDYRVMPLEGLWWADDQASFLSGDKGKWKWTAMIMQPAFVTRAHVGEAIAAAGRKRPSEMLTKLRFESFREGLCAQLLHVGPYSDEGSDIQRLHAFIAEQGGELTGRHHEIYLGDPRRAAPEKLRTIIRQPFSRR
jgi:hypothetical protein